MTPDKLMVGMSLAISEFLQGEEKHEHPFAYVLILTEVDHSGDASDRTPVRLAINNLRPDDVIALLRSVADSLERSTSTEH